MLKNQMQGGSASSALQTAIAIACLLLYMQDGRGNEGDMLWYQAYGGLLDDKPFALLPTADGGWMIGAETYSFGAGSTDAWLIRLNSHGDTLWSNTYGDIFHQYVESLIPANDSGWLLIANQLSNTLNAWIARVGENGETTWTWLYNGEAEDEFITALPLPDGCLAAGHTMSIGAGGSDQWLVRFNDVGDTLWTRNWGGWNTEQTNFLMPTNDGGSLLIGSTTSFSPLGQQVTLWRNNDQGDSLWLRVYGDDEPQEATDIVAVPDGGWLLSCVAYFHFGYSVDDIWLLRVDENGNEIWSKYYGSPNNEVIAKIMPLADGGWLLAGTAHPNGPQDPDFYLLRVDANGDSLWGRTYGTLASEWDLSAIVTPDSGCLLAGSVYFAGTENSNWWILKTDADGDSQWSMIFGDSLSGDFVRSLALTPEGNYLIVGESHVGAVGYTDVGVMCLEGPSTGIIPAPFSQPFCFMLQKPHPNPFNPATALSYQLPASSFVSLRVYDIAGKLVQTLVNGWRDAGSHEATFDGSNLTSGVYIYRLIAGDFAASGKMVLMK